MRANANALSAVVAVVLAAVPVVDGSFLVRGVMPQQPRRTAPLFQAPPIVIEQQTIVAQPPRLRCPMQVVEGDPKLDAKIAKPAPAQPLFTLRVGPPPCTAK